MYRIDMLRRALIQQHAAVSSRCGAATPAAGARNRHRQKHLAKAAVDANCGSDTTTGS